MTKYLIFIIFNRQITPFLEFIKSRVFCSAKFYEKLDLGSLYELETTAIGFSPKQKSGKI